MALYLNDITSNANTLTNNGATEVTSSLAFAESTKAALFTSASSQYMSAVDASSLKPTGNFTVEGWIKTSTASGTFFQTYSQNTNVAGIFFEIDGLSKLRFVVGKNTGTVLNTDYSDLRSTTSVATGSWVHVAATYDGSNMKIYVNGNSTADSSQASSINPAYAATNYVRLGCANTTGSNTNYFNGTIDDVRLWNVARTGAQINANYNKQLTGTESGLVAYWPFEIISGTGALFFSYF